MLEKVTVLLECQMTFRRFMGFTAMAFLWTGSQIPVYLFGEFGSKPCFTSFILIDEQEEFRPISMEI